MDIVLVHYAAAPIIGGVENVMQQHARLMAQAGHRVRIIAGRGEAVDAGTGFERLPLADSKNAEILAVKSKLDEGSVPPEFGPLTDRLETELEPRVRDADWLIAHNVCSLNKNLMLTAALRRLCQPGRRPRFILWHHDLAWTTPRYTPELHPGYPWDLLRTDWPEALQVVVSAQRRRELAELLGVTEERIRVVPNGVDPNAFLSLGEQTRRYVKELRLFDAAPVMLLPVRITRRKNIEMGIRVLASLRSRFPRAQLLVTGPRGPHNAANTEYLQSLVALRHDLHLDGAVHFLTESGGAPLAYEVIAELYRVADLLFLPSTEEGFGIPVLEAGLAGIPIVCSDISTLRDLGGSDVMYFSPGADAAQVANLVGDALEASRRYSMRQRVLQDYTWARIYTEHVAPLLEGR